MWDHATAPHFGSGVAAGAAAPGGAPFIKIGGCSGFGAPNVKFTLIVVSTSVGTPSTRYGLYFHRCTASIAACCSIGGPLTTSRFSTSPVFERIACSTTTPCTCAAFASGGYTGATGSDSKPATTPDDTVT